MKTNTHFFRKQNSNFLKQFQSTSYSSVSSIYVADTCYIVSSIALVDYVDQRALKMYVADTRYIVSSILAVSQRFHHFVMKSDTSHIFDHDEQGDEDNWHRVMHSIIASSKMNRVDCFHQWLVGFTEGDGCFFIDQQKTKKAGHFTWNLGFKIALSKYNIRGLVYIKKKLKTGHISDDGKHMVQYRIRDRKILATVLFPIFDKNPMLSSKFYDYQLVRRAFDILENKETSSQEKDQLLIELLQKEKQDKLKKRISPLWFSHLSKSRVEELQKADWYGVTHQEVLPIISPWWLSGFIEADGSFYITKKEKNRFCHGFALTQKDPQLLHTIRAFLHITAKVRCRTNSMLCQPDWLTPSSMGPSRSDATPLKMASIISFHDPSVLKIRSSLRDASVSSIALVDYVDQRTSQMKEKSEKKSFPFYILDTTNRRVLKRVQKICHKKLFTSKSLEFSLWKRSFQWKSNDPRLKKTQQIMRKIRGSSHF